MTSTITDIIQGVETHKAFKVPCRVATTGNITLSGLQTIDGVSLAADDRVLVKDQSTGAQNGIYRAASGTWARFQDFDGARDLVSGTKVFVTSGATNGRKEFYLQTADPISIDTTSLVFAQSEPQVQTLYDVFLSKSANYPVVANDEGAMILVDTSGGAVTITLPTVATVGDFKIGAAKTTSDTNAVTVVRSGSDTIDGATSFILATQYDVVTLVCKSGTTNWLVTADAHALGTAGFKQKSNGSNVIWAAPEVQTLNVMCQHEGLTAAWASNSTATITASAVVLRNTSGGLKRFESLSETLNIASSGANGLDTGAEAGNTWYHVWAIGKEDGTLDGLLSTSSTAPTMPSGYTYKGYIGAIRNNGSSNFVDFRQVGFRVSAAELSALSSGTATSPTSVDLSALVPTTAKEVKMRADVISTSGTIQVSLVVAATSGGIGSNFAGGSSTSGSINILASLRCMLVTAQTVFYNVTGANMSANLYVDGWEY